MKYYLDTNIISYAIKGKFTENLTKHFMSVPKENIFVSSIVMSELEYGSYLSSNYDLVMSKNLAFIKQFECEDYKKSYAKVYGNIRSYLKEEGIPIGQNDLFIASQVLAENGILVTHNVDEFKRVPNLKIEDWCII